MLSRLQEDPFRTSFDDTAFVRDGYAEIRIWLVDTSEKTLGRLKRAGFEFLLDPKDGTVIGRIALEKLEGLSQLPPVRYIAPVLG